MPTPKPSRNSRCTCGSGKLYRKCCRPKPLPKGLIEKVRKIFTDRENDEKQFISDFGHIRPPMGLKHQGSALVVIGGSIYKQTRPGEYTFLHAIHDHALEFFGTSMLEAEEQKPFEQRHPALQWMELFVANSNRPRTADDAGGRIGAGAAWHRLAYDLYTIRDNAKLEAAMKVRLLDPARFQGARHELYVAALCVAAGFELQFEDESDGSKTHPEFVGTDKFTKTQIAVEAKSRHRKGVKGFAGGKYETPGATVGIRSLVTDAFKKVTDLPLYVFVDVNLPPGPEAERKRWLAEIEQTMSDLGQEGYDDPSPANAIFFNNDPSHYMLEQQIGGEESCLWFKPFFADQPKTPHPSDDVFDRLVKAHDQRISAPADFPKFSNPQWKDEEARKKR